MDGSPTGLSSPFRLRLELLGIALEKKGPDILETRTQGKCTGTMLRIVWRLMSSRSPRLGRSSRQMPGQGSLTHSPRGNCQGQKQDPSPRGASLCPAYHVPGRTPHQWQLAAALDKVIKSIQFSLKSRCGCEEATGTDAASRWVVSPLSPMASQGCVPTNWLRQHCSHHLGQGA